MLKHAVAQTELPLARTIDADYVAKMAYDGSATHIFQKIAVMQKKQMILGINIVEKSFLNTCSSLSKNPRGNKTLLLVRKQRLHNASCTPCFSQWKNNGRAIKR
ncbi:hypothetical protein Tsp_08947 [Trichinella spiralis]|uniref:hypothetical protein n=1 Tax=Trichinella spiralis TaxID=6334 RepID=UPI0001EFC163|nr:hypothetical protein Tsp_08947 [Trichinella spiralis]